MRMAYTDKRMDLSKMSIKNSSAAGGSQSVEPGFRIYGKNNAVNEFNQIIKFKQKKRIPG